MAGSREHSTKSRGLRSADAVSRIKQSRKTIITEKRRDNHLDRLQQDSPGGDQGLPRDATGDSESVEEPVEEGNSFEAGIVFGPRQSFLQLVRPACRVHPLLKSAHLHPSPDSGLLGNRFLSFCDHHEPHFRSRSPMCVPGRHLGMIGRKDLFHKYASIRELPRLAVILSSPRRCVRVVHLGGVVEIQRCIYSKRLIEVSKISGLANVSRLSTRSKPL